MPLTFSPRPSEPGATAAQCQTRNRRLWAEMEIRRPESVDPVVLSKMRPATAQVVARSCPPHWPAPRHSLWPGGLQAGSLGALLAAAGVPAGAWPGPAASASTAGPGLPGAHAGEWPGLAASASTAGSGLPGAHAGAWLGLAVGASTAGPVLPGAQAGVGAAEGAATTAHGVAAWGGAGLEGASHGGWPEFLATAAAALANSRVVTAAAPAISKDTTSQEVRLDARHMELFEVPADPFPSRASTGRRRDGHARRPPPAARNAAPASVDVDLTDSGYDLLLLIH
jgi:hypothetical protein